ncbi:MAG TPA: hypothetical protein VF278_17085, partial [Pirellulales bacterium]
MERILGWKMAEREMQNATLDLPYGVTSAGVIFRFAFFVLHFALVAGASMAVFPGRSAPAFAAAPKAKPAVRVALNSAHKTTHPSPHQILPSPHGAPPAGAIPLRPSYPMPPEMVGIDLMRQSA